MSAPVKTPPPAIDRDLSPVLLFERFDRRKDLREKDLEGEFLGLPQLFERKPQVPARQGPFENDRVGRSRVASVPGPENEVRGPAGADDGQELDRHVIDHLGQLEGQGGARNDELDPFPDRRLDQVPGVAQHPHDIDRDGPVGQAFGPPDLIDQRVAGNFVEIGLGFFDIAQAHRSDGADAALVGHGRGQAGQGNPDAHAALNERERHMDVPDV